MTGNGPNGMTADKDGAVLLCQHGNRRIVRIDKDMKISTLVDKFEGKKLNSPNDLVFHSDGSLYFTDPRGDDRAIAAFTMSAMRTEWE